MSIIFARDMIKAIATIAYIVLGYTCAAQNQFSTAHQDSSINSRDPRSKDAANVWWNGNFPLYSLVSDKVILPKAEGYYEMWCASNELLVPFKLEIRVYGNEWHLTFDDPKTKKRVANFSRKEFLQYKFISYEECLAWCNDKKIAKTRSVEHAVEPRKIDYTAINNKLKPYFNKNFLISKIPIPSVIDGQINDQETKVLYKQYYYGYSSVNRVLASLKFIKISNRWIEVEIIPNDGNYHTNDNRTEINCGRINNINEIHTRFGVSCSDCWLHVSIPLDAFEEGNPLYKVLAEYGRQPADYVPKFTVKYRTGEINNQITSETNPCELFNEDCYKTLAAIIREGFQSYNVSNRVPTISDLQYSMPRGDIMVVEEQALVNYIGIPRSTEPKDLNDVARDYFRERGTNHTSSSNGRTYNTTAERKCCWCGKAFTGRGWNYSLGECMQGDGDYWCKCSMKCCMESKKANGQ